MSYIDWNFGDDAGTHYVDQSERAIRKRASDEDGDCYESSAKADILVLLRIIDDERAKVAALDESLIS